MLSEEQKIHCSAFFKNALKTIDEMDRDTVNVIDSLSNRGWFIWLGDGAIKDYLDKHSKLFNATPLEQDGYMFSYVQTNVAQFRDELRSGYPNRERQIFDAFHAHENQLFYASIPVLLSLSEGIGRDLIGSQLKNPQDGIYSTRNKKPVLEDLFSGVQGVESFEMNWLSPLYKSTALTASGTTLTSDQKTQFNRHWILHGNSDAYGSEENSLKAISLVYFVHKSIARLKDILAGNI
jgi:hypothetical protein